MITVAVQNKNSEGEEISLGLLFLKFVFCVAVECENLIVDS